MGMRLKGWMLLPLLAASVVGGVSWWRNRPLELATVHPQRGEAVLAVYATGVVEPTVNVPIAPRVGGRLVQLLADEGARVRRGQVLARLEDANLQHGIEQLEAQESFARQALDRQESLLARGLGARADRDRVAADWRAAKAATDRAREEQGFMQLVAPADGMVMRRDGEVGQYIAVNQVVFHVATSRSLRISADVDEEDIPRVVVGQRAMVRADAFPDSAFEGRVLEVTPRGDASTRSYRVRVSLPADAPLRVGMSCDTNIIIDQHEGALLLPAAALRDGKAWVVRDGRATRVPVRTGISGARQVELLEGLAEADDVVASPPEGLAEGRRVRMRATAAPAAAPAGAGK